jgi:hypothetical protein
MITSSDATKPSLNRSMAAYVTCAHGIDLKSASSAGCLHIHCQRIHRLHKLLGGKVHQKCLTSIGRTDEPCRNTTLVNFNMIVIHKSLHAVMHRTKCCPWVPEKGWIYLCKLLLEQHMRLLGQEFSRMSLWVSHATRFSAMPCSQWPFGHPHWSRQMPCQWKPQYLSLVKILPVLHNRSNLLRDTKAEP